MSKYLSRESILKHKGRSYDTVEVPEWNDGETAVVRLRTLTGRERDLFEASTVEMKGNKQKSNFDNLRARLVSLCAVDEEGERIFNSQDIKDLGELSAVALNRVFEKCQQMNGLSEQDVEEMTAVFDNDQGDGSLSD